MERAERKMWIEHRDMGGVKRQGGGDRCVRGVDGERPSRSRRRISRCVSSYLDQWFRLQRGDWRLVFPAKSPRSVYLFSSAFLFWKGGHTSFEPRPNPAITSPSIRRGYGFSGPVAAPTIVSRGFRVGVLSDIFVKL